VISSSSSIAFTAGQTEDDDDHEHDQEIPRLNPINGNPELQALDSPENGQDRPAQRTRSETLWWLSS
jgi:hypothetical protein